LEGEIPVFSLKALLKVVFELKPDSRAIPRIL
jgi:hypothetical protein